jgi:hypothetical protein
LAALLLATILLTALAVLASVVLKIFSFLSPRMFGLLLHTQKKREHHR